MNKALFLLFPTMLALAACTCKCPEVSPKSVEIAPKEDSAMETILSRLSVRSFVEGRQIPKEVLKELVKAGMAAPSAMDRRPWAFVVISEKDRLTALAAAHPHAKMLLTASAAIIPVATVDLSQPGAEKGFWTQDLSAVTENILLAAHSKGLGAVWVGVYSNDERVKNISEFLHLPAGVVPFSIIPLGYPKEPGQAKNKYDESRIHWENWE